MRTFYSTIFTIILSPLFNRNGHLLLFKLLILFYYLMKSATACKKHYGDGWNGINRVSNWTINDHSIGRREVYWNLVKSWMTIWLSKIKCVKLPKKICCLCSPNNWSRNGKVCVCSCMMKPWNQSDSNIELAGT